MNEASRQNLEEVLNTFVRFEERRDTAAHAVRDLESSIQDLEVDMEVLDRVSDLFRTLIDREVLDNVQSTELLLTEGLNAVFEDMDLSVRSEVDIQRGKVSVDLVTKQVPPTEPLRKAPFWTRTGAHWPLWSLSFSALPSSLRRGLRPLILLDESLAAVSEHYVPRVGRFLSVLCDRMGFDILSVTHNQSLVEASDKAYRITLREGRRGSSLSERGVDAKGKRDPTESSSRRASGTSSVTFVIAFHPEPTGLGSRSIRSSRSSGGSSRPHRSTRSRVDTPTWQHSCGCWRSDRDNHSDSTGHSSERWVVCPCGLTPRRRRRRPGR